MNECPWEFVAVHWLDAFDGDSGWVTISDYQVHAQSVVNVGWVWPDCLAGHLTLVASTCPSEYDDMKVVGQVFHIPLKMIERVESLVQPTSGVVEARPDIKLGVN